MHCVNRNLTVITVRKRSCGKVMFLHLSVSHSVHRGGSVHAGIHTPRTDTPPWADTPCPVHAGIDMATAADSTHPTGMHSCVITIHKHGLRRLCFYRCVSVHRGMHGGGMHGGGMHGRGHVWHRGACVAGGVCMAGEHAWWWGHA